MKTHRMRLSYAHFVGERVGHRPAQRALVSLCGKDDVTCTKLRFVPRGRPITCETCKRLERQHHAGNL